ncbi:DUF6385 domain-containing protein, partial [Clostridium ihumii]|uniref:DUF6385 domain-containing protein n=1 Tax=Clostridium ihumii TaxID=1470356 RepID=UPI00058CA0DD
VSVTGIVQVSQVTQGTVTVAGGSIAISNAPSVNVANTVPVTGTVQVASGSVDITNTPSVKVDNTVSVTGTVQVSQLTQGTVTVAGGTINIGYTQVGTATSINANGTGTTLVEDISDLTDYSYFVYNKGTQTVILNIEVAPTNVDGDYTSYNQATVTLGSNKSAVVIPSTIYGNYARIYYDTLSAAATFDIYYVGR